MSKISATFYQLTQSKLFIIVFVATVATERLDLDLFCSGSPEGR